MAAADDPDGVKLFGTGGIILINADLTSNILLLLFYFVFTISYRQNHFALIQCKKKEHIPNLLLI